jgi:hypothetical protein
MHKPPLKTCKQLKRNKCQAAQQMNNACKNKTADADCNAPAVLIGPQLAGVVVINGQRHAGIARD